MDRETKIWGPFSGLFGGVGIYALSQIISVIILSIYAEFSGQTIAELIDKNPIIVNFAGGLLLSASTVLLVYLAAKKFGGWKALKLEKFPSGKLTKIALAVIMYLAFAGTLYALAAFLFPSIDLDQEQQIGFESANSFIQIAIAFLALVVFAPISEEILFRGYIFQGLNTRMHWLVAAAISSSLFGLAHMQLNVAIDTFALGVVACWLLRETASLWPAILLHAIKNSVAFYFLFVAS
jgi:membrane protease YdiL (CAAX protease family)